MTERPILIAGKSCYVAADLIAKLEVGQRGLDWYVLCYLDTPNDSLQANVALLAGPFAEERDATEACERIVDDVFDVRSIHRGGQARWAWHDDTTVRAR